MRYAIYSRKSKFTGKGESIENQIEMCRNHIAAKFPDDKSIEIEVFEDEGFSGKNVKRPEFQRLMAEIKGRRFNFLVCYRLDRISRNVADFASTLKDLQRYDVSFISIRESFDTSTPMGRAMMSITAVFAELERDTIAERIRDNMMMLARSGRWLGGITPLGFSSAQVKKETVGGKEQTSYKLAPIKDELELVRQIFSMYLDAHSLTKIETHFINNDILTRKGVRFTPIALREILANPVYCIADKQAHGYFTKHESLVCSDPEEFDGKHGISTYNRTSNTGGKQSKQPMSEWIVAVGKHRGIIPFGDWEKAQRILASNRHLSISYKPQNNTALLSGVLVCKNCGSAMRPRVDSNKPLNEKGEQRFAYMCELKRKSKKGKCDCTNINGNQLDDKVCEEILKFRQGNSEIGRKLAALKAGLQNGSSATEKQLQSSQKRMVDKQGEINGLIRTLSKEPDDSALYTHTKSRVDELDKEIHELKKQCFELEQELQTSTDYDFQVEKITRALQTFHSTFELASVQDKRDFLKSIIERIEWDGENIHIFLHGEQQ